MSCRNTPRTPKNPPNASTPKSTKPPKRCDVSNGSSTGKPNTTFTNDGRSPRKRVHPVTPSRDAFQTPTAPQKRENPQYYFTPDCFMDVSLNATPKVLKKTPNVKERGAEESNLTVAVRVRPMNPRELVMPAVQSIIEVNGNEVTVLAGKTADNSAGITRGFNYDHTFWSCNSEHENYADQKVIFDKIGAPLVDRAFEGYNVCLFAYGQTSSGKSYSMMGIDTDNSIAIGANSELGIIPRFCHELFRRIEDMKDTTLAQVEVSYFEIYNEKIHDLLSVTTCHNTKNVLKVREHHIYGPHVPDLSAHPVDSYTALKNWMILGNSQRATATTGMNDKSSRSHSIFTIVLKLCDRGTGTAGQTRRSKISLVDLAGSERMSHTADNGERLKEGISINRSLLALGKVIKTLGNAGENQKHVPYRDSVLTWLLKENLGGNSKTVMLATISPANIHLEETLATLRYACQARTIVNRVKVNEDPQDKVIRELKGEIECLQMRVQDYERQQKRQAVTESGAIRHIVIDVQSPQDGQKLEKLRTELAQTKQELAKYQTPWGDRLQEGKSMQMKEMESLKRKGFSLDTGVSRKEPCLVNLDPDCSLSGTLVFRLPPGVVKIGRSHPSSNDQPDIVLEGPLVAFSHCSIENNAGCLSLKPISQESDTFINGQLIDKEMQLHHGDRVVIGGSHYFRVSNPLESGRQGETVWDFQQAHQEILREQERRLREELDVVKRSAEKEMRDELDRLKSDVERLERRKDYVEAELEVLRTCATEAVEVVEEPPSRYKSNILNDLETILTHPSRESLHEIKMQVKEATQRCRDLGLEDYAFRQGQVCDESGVSRAIVNIIDRRKRLVADWPPARLEVWLEMMRESEVDPSCPFGVLPVEWKSIEDTLEGSFNESLTNSNKRISLNWSGCLGSRTPPSRKSAGVKPVLRKFNPSAQKNLFPDLQSTPKENTPLADRSQTPGDFATNARKYVKDINLASSCLRNLCHDDQMSRRGRQVFTLMDEMDKITCQLMQMLKEENSAHKTPPKTPKSVRFCLD